MTKSLRWGQSPLQSTFPHWPPLPSSHIPSILPSHLPTHHPTTLTNQSTPPHTSQVLHNNQAHHQCGRKISHHSPGSLQHHLTGELKRCISGFQRFYICTRFSMYPDLPPPTYAESVWGVADVRRQVIFRIILIFAGGQFYLCGK